ncbi:MAG: tubulin-like doman-containing protein, partial [Actinomycetes bacterium]
MLDKFVMIGLGGSGGATVRYSADNLHRALERANWRHGLPQAWQFLHIDAPVTADGGTDDVPFEVLERVRYQPLGSQNGVYSALDQIVEMDKGLSLETAGWRPDPNDPGVKLILPGTGAGQMRSVGRVIGLTARSHINDSIQSALGRVNDSGANSELELLSKHLADTYGDNDERKGVLRVIIVTSWGGGAGSGLFTDVLENLKALSAQNPALANNIAIIAYAPEVSEMNPGTQGVAPNSFAAMCEYMNLFERASDDGLASGAKNLQKLLMVGASGFEQKLKMRSDREVYRYVGGSLAKIFTDQNQLEFISAYLFQNPQDEPYTVDFPFGDASAPRAAKSFGTASVTLGHDVFERYASECFANQIIDTMLNGFRGETAFENVPADVAVQRLVERDKREFFRRSGLDEESDKFNDVLDALKGTKSDSTACEGRWNGFLDRVGETLATGAQSQPRDQWRDDSSAMFNRGLPDVMSVEYNVVEARRNEWVRDVQACFLNAVTEMGVAGHGLKYAQGLVAA